MSVDGLYVARCVRVKSGTRDLFVRARVSVSVSSGGERIEGFERERRSVGVTDRVVRSKTHDVTNARRKCSR
mgnify:CR=1 FL=1